MLAVSLASQTVALSRPPEQIAFVGYSWPHFAAVRQGLAERLTGYPQLRMRQATLADYQLVHTADYLQQLTRLANEDRTPPRAKLSAECVGLTYAMEGYLFSLGGLLEAIDQFQRDQVACVYCFALPGHHAFPDWEHGYCILNPQAAAVRYAQSHGFRRVVLIDWDIHHGDGTQAIFAHDPTVFCISVHSAIDLYMAKVADWRLGMTRAGVEAGHCNLPVLHELFDDAYLGKLQETYGTIYRAATVLPAFRSALEALPWSPDLLMIFSGYDAHRDDCGQRITNWTNAEFVQLTQWVVELAQRVGCPILSVHGGGYKLPVTLAAAQCHVETLATLKT